MGFFSFIESFFFLSLGITFVLIFLMVFHFKQRVEQLEKKNENMLEVCNGLVQQIHGLKTFCISNQSGSPFLAPSGSGSNKISENITFSTSSPIPIPNLETSSANANPFQKIVVEDFEDEDEEEDEEDEEEDIDVSDELEEELFSRTEEIKGDVPGMEEVEMDVLEENILDSYSYPTEEIPSEEIPSEEIPSEEIPSEEIPSEEIPSEEIPSEEPRNEEDIDIKNLSLQQLRQLASNKGLSTNPNKMKKQELLQLLQKTSTEPKTSTEKSLQDLAFLL